MQLRILLLAVLCLYGRSAPVASTNDESESEDSTKAANSVGVFDQLYLSQLSAALPGVDLDSLVHKAAASRMEVYKEAETGNEEEEATLEDESESADEADASESEELEHVSETKSEAESEDEEEFDEEIGSDFEEQQDESFDNDDEDEEVDEAESETPVLTRRDEQVSQSLFWWKHDDCDGGDDDDDDHWPHKVIYVKFGLNDTTPLAIKEHNLQHYSKPLSNNETAHAAAGTETETFEAQTFRKWLLDFLEGCEAEEENDDDCDDETLLDQVMEQDGRTIFVAFTNTEDTKTVVERLQEQFKELKKNNNNKNFDNQHRQVYLSIDESIIDDHTTSIASVADASSEPDTELPIHAAYSLREVMENLYRNQQRERESDPCDKDFENDVSYFDEEIDCDRFIYVSWGNQSTPLRKDVNRQQMSYGEMIKSKQSPTTASAGFKQFHTNKTDVVGQRKQLNKNNKNIKDMNSWSNFKSFGNRYSNESSGSTRDKINWSLMLFVSLLVGFVTGF